MKRSRLSYDEWKCIESKKLKGKQVNTDFFKGYIGILEIEKVTESFITEPLRRGRKLVLFQEYEGNYMSVNLPMYSSCGDHMS